jgi:aryl-alcohol dehydrogenase-like predicted oxidoreductase
MLDQSRTAALQMEQVAIPGTALNVSRVAHGTWAIGGWMWGGTDEAESVATIRAAVERGINVIDTAPAYGSGGPKKSSARRLPKASCARAC